jgi:Mg-chelatase subunit ChlI
LGEEEEDKESVSLSPRTEARVFTELKQSSFPELKLGFLQKRIRTWKCFLHRYRAVEEELWRRLRGSGESGFGWKERCKDSAEEEEEEDSEDSEEEEDSEDSEEEEEEEDSEDSEEEEEEEDSEEERSFRFRC